MADNRSTWSSQEPAFDWLDSLLELNERVAPEIHYHTVTGPQRLLGALYNLPQNYVDWTLRTGGQNLATVIGRPVPVPQFNERFGPGDPVYPWERPVRVEDPVTRSNEAPRVEDPKTKPSEPVEPMRPETRLEMASREGTLPPPRTGDQPPQEGVDQTGPRGTETGPTPQAPLLHEIPADVRAQFNENPEVGMAYVLQTREIHPDSPVGEWYVNVAPALQEGYWFADAPEVGQVVTDNNATLEFFDWYVRTSRSTDPQAAQELHDFQNHIRNQVNAAIQGQGEIGQVFATADPETWWERLIAPGMQMLHLTPQAQRARQNQFEQLIREYERVRATENIHFAEFLRREGYTF